LPENLETLTREPPENLGENLTVEGVTETIPDFHIKAGTESVGNVEIVRLHIFIQVYSCLMQRHLAGLVIELLIVEHGKYKHNAFFHGDNLPFCLLLCVVVAVLLSKSPNPCKVTRYQLPDCAGLLWPCKAAGL